MTDVDKKLAFDGSVQIESYSNKTRVNELIAVTM